MRIIFLGFFIRILIGFYEVFYGPSPWASGDSHEFNRVAIEYSNGFTEFEFKIGYIYSYFLGIVYYLTANSILIGCLLSSCVWLISAIFLDKSVRLLEMSNSNRTIILLFYSFIPTSILFTSVTLREVYQLCAINLVIYAALKIYIDKMLRYWILLIFSCLLMTSLHAGLGFLALVILLCTLYLQSMRGQKGISPVAALAYTPLLLFFGYFTLSNFFSSSILGEGRFEDGIAFAIEAYQAGHNEARAMYNYKPKIDGLGGLIIFFPISFLQYLFEPMPWRVVTFLDAALFVENILRGIFIFLGLYSYFKTTGNKKIIMLFLLVVYFVAEGIWAIGTINWGTAARHHVPVTGLLLLVAFYSPYFKDVKLRKRLS